MDGISDPLPSPEDLRQHEEDPSCLTVSHHEDIETENSTEPSLENISVIDEDLSENKE